MHLLRRVRRCARRSCPNCGGELLDRPTQGLKNMARQAPASDGCRALRGMTHAPHPRHRRLGQLGRAPASGRYQDHHVLGGYAMSRDHRGDRAEHARRDDGQSARPRWSRRRSTPACPTSARTQRRSACSALHDIAAIVAERLEGLAIPIVFDPVMVATSGSVLADAATIGGFERLMKLATLTTPTSPELEALGGADGHGAAQDRLSSPRAATRRRRDPSRTGWSAPAWTTRCGPRTDRHAAHPRHRLHAQARSRPCSAQWPNARTRHLGCARVRPLPH